MITDDQLTQQETHPPSRFVAVSGTTEQFFADIRNARIGTVADVLTWYNTPTSPEQAIPALIG